MKKLNLWVAALAVACMAGSASAGTWTPLTNQPTINASTMLLLTDGRVLTHNEYSAEWWILTPDSFGSYKNGTWSKTGSTKWTRLYYGSGVFKDGRVIVCGGEYSNGGSWTNKTEIYNPATGTWTEIAAPQNWANIGDASCAMLEDGRFFTGNAFDARTAFLNPANLTWANGPSMINGRSDEETWIVMPDNTVLKWDCFGHPGSGKWNPNTNTWINLGNTATDLVLPGSFETGAAILLPDGRAFCIGGTPRTNFYTMGALPEDKGAWSAGPDTPKINGRNLGAEDAPAAMTPDGHVLMALGPVSTQGGSFESPTYFFEFDGTNIVRVSDPPTSNKVPYAGHMLNLPSGEILFANGQPKMYLYTNDGQPQDAWRPVITNVSYNLASGGSYVLTGKQLNGVTNGSSYGDEAYTATNYAIVRLTNTVTNKVYFARSFDPSTYGVQTGDKIVTTNFQVPANVPSGVYRIEAIASGIGSKALNVAVGQAIRVSSYAVNQGKYQSGDLPDLFSNDDSYLRVKNDIVLGKQFPQVQVTFRGTSLSLSPSNLSVTVEAAANSTGLSQVLEAYNYQTLSYETIDSRASSQADAGVVVPLSGDLSRFVDQATGEMTTRVSYYRTGPATTFNFTARFDTVTWSE